MQTFHTKPALVPTFFIFSISFCSANIALSAPVTAPPRALHYQCSSTELGTLDIQMNNPQQLTIGESIRYYDMHITYFNAQGAFVDEKFYDTKNANYARAVLDLGEPVINTRPNIIFTIPSAGNLNWEKYSNECYVPAPAPGVSMTLDLDHLLVKDDGGSRPFIMTHLSNPKIEVQFVSGTPFSIPTDFLNDKQCPSTEQSKHAKAQIRCLSKEVIESLTNLDNN